MAFSLCACDSNVKNVHTHEVQSELYSQADIDSAIAIITKEFIVHWKGCALKEIYNGMDKLIVNVDKETLTQMMADPIYANYFDIENQIKHR